MNISLLAIAVPIFVSVTCLVSKRAAPWIALALSAAETYMAAVIFFSGGTDAIANFHVETLNSGIFLAASISTLLIVLYSFSYMSGRDRIREYYCYILITLGASAGAFFANDYFTLLSFWGILGATLYLLIGIAGPQAASAAKKTLIIVGGSDAFMIFGIGAVYLMTGNLQIGIYPVRMIGMLPAVGFLSLLTAALAKAGAMPLHSWIPDCADVAPVPVTAYIPAALDKFLGIYLLFRLCTDIFLVTPNSQASILLLAIGSFTIIAAVMSALVQHDLKKLLSFHAVSQVGYMVLGIGTAVPVGMAGALFHMLNNAIYKCCLFLSSGAVEKETGTTELDKLGGLGEFMPITFICASVAALSISGVPPFNGFVSKWMIYQALIELPRTGGLWMIWLVCAMIGSAFTLASFLKVIHSIFLGQWSGLTKKAKEVSWLMWAPMAALALLCVVFGVFAFPLPLAKFIIPSVPDFSYTGSWHPLLATGLLIVGLLIGALIYLAGRITNVTVKTAYIGGEVLSEEEVKVPVTGFYNTIRDWGPLKRIYAFAETGSLDIYEAGSRVVGWSYSVLGWLHNGLLHTYMSWMFIGFIFIMLSLIL